MARENLAIIGWRTRPLAAQIPRALARLLKETYPDEKQNADQLRASSGLSAKPCRWATWWRCRQSPPCHRLAQSPAATNTSRISPSASSTPSVRWEREILAARLLGSAQFLWCCVNTPKIRGTMPRTGSKRCLAGVPNLLVQLQKLKRPSTWSS